MNNSVQFQCASSQLDPTPTSTTTGTFNGIAVSILLLMDEIIVAPETDVDEMAALINKCDVIIANDSGPMHISAALDIPTLGIFGPTDPKKHRPYSANSDYIIKDDLHCIICNKLTCPYDHECMKELPSSEVILKVEQLGKSFLKRK